MVDPIAGNLSRALGVNPASAVNPAAAAGTGKTTGQDDFAQALRAQLEQVSSMQREADEGVQKILTGESNNYAEVFSAAQKADVAFSLLMEIRNKMVEAYEDVRRIQV